MSDDACTHGDGQAFVAGECVFCGAKRGRGRPPGKARKPIDLKATRTLAPPSKAELRTPIAFPHQRFVAPPVEAEPAARFVKRELSPEERLRAATEYVCRTSLAEFVKRAWHVTDPTVALDWNWHHDAICLHLERMFREWLAITRGDLPALARLKGITLDELAAESPKPRLTIQNLAVNVPPGTNKSRIISVFFPAWAWLHEPAWRVICLSANPQVADRDAPVSRQLIESPWYQETFKPRWALNPDINARAWYANSAGGERRSFGIEAKIVGLRADALLVDDPNDPKEVHSEVAREAVNVRSWDQTVGNRLNNLDHGLRILIQQRLHDDDLTGHLLRQSGESGAWEHLKIPLLWEPRNECQCRTCKRGSTLFNWTDPRTTGGEVLHASRFPQHVIDFERGRLGSYGFAGQMQQSPAPDGGGIFKRQWFKTYDQLPDRIDDVLIAADLANKKTTVGSFNVLTVGIKSGPWRYIVDVRRNRGDWTARKIAELLKELQTEWRGKLGRMPKILVEDKAMGPTVIEMLIQDLGVQGVIQDDEAQLARDDKVSRAMAVQPTVEGGSVMLPKGAPWVDEFLHEVCTFPVAANDDQTDTLTMILNYWRMASNAAKFIATYGRGRA